MAAYRDSQQKFGRTAPRATTETSDESSLSEGVRAEHGSAPTPDADDRLDAPHDRSEAEVGRSRRDWAHGHFSDWSEGGIGRPAIPAECREENGVRGPESARFLTREWGVTTTNSPPARRRRAAEEERQTDKSSLLEG